MSEHDTAKYLETVYLSKRSGRGGSLPGFGGAGWYVRRTCECHKGRVVSVRFATPIEAKACLEALDADARRYARPTT